MARDQFLNSSSCSKKCGDLTCTVKVLCKIFLCEHVVIQGPVTKGVVRELNVLREYLLEVRYVCYKLLRRAVLAFFEQDFDYLFHFF